MKNMVICIWCSSCRTSSSSTATVEQQSWRSRTLTRDPPGVSVCPPVRPCPTCPPSTRPAGTPSYPPGQVLCLQSYIVCFRTVLSFSVLLNKCVFKLGRQRMYSIMFMYYIGRKESTWSE